MKASLFIHLTAVLTFAAAAGAHDAQHHHETAAAPPGAAKVALVDEALLDQAGRRVRLASEVIGGRIAIVNFIYTTCTTVCPIASATFAQLQDRLGAELGKEVVLVSISVDPVRDTPARLSEISARFGARPGWTWLTGAKREVDGVLKGFGAYAPNVEDHPAMVLVGDASGGGWTRFFGFPSVEQLLAHVDAVHAAREGRKVAHHHAKE
jgi:protein SCO1/2